MAYCFRAVLRDERGGTLEHGCSPSTLFGTILATVARMNTFLEMTVDTTQIEDVKFRAAFDSLPNVEYATGSWFIQTDHSPTEFAAIVKPYLGGETPKINRISADSLRDAVLPYDARAWFSKVAPTLTLVSSSAA